MDMMRINHIHENAKYITFSSVIVVGHRCRFVAPLLRIYRGVNASSMSCRFVKNFLTFFFSFLSAARFKENHWNLHVAKSI